MLESAGFDFRNRYPQKVMVKLARALRFDAKDEANLEPEHRFIQDFCTAEAVHTDSGYCVSRACRTAAWKRHYEIRGCGTRKVQQVGY